MKESLVSLNHEFVIVDNDIDKSSWNKISSDFCKNKKNFEYVAIYDDYIQYFSDFFNFFTLYNLARDENIQGLCYYGVTKIPFEALDSVLEMLELILRIFEFAPDEINLTNNYVCVFAHNPDFIGNHKKGYCKRLKISKDKFCKKLKDVIKLFSKAKTEKRCIIHIGI